MGLNEGDTPPVDLASLVRDLNNGVLKDEFDEAVGYDPDLMP